MSPRKYLLRDFRLTGQPGNARREAGAVEKDPRNPLSGEDQPWEVPIDNQSWAAATLSRAAASCG
jgi:hypothetical protein